MLLNTNTKRGWLALVGCLLVDLSVGEFNLLSFLYKYFTSYFRIVYDQNLTEDDMIIIPIIWVAAMAFGSPLGVATYGKLGFKGTFLFYVSIFSGSHYGLSYITNFYIFAFVYAFFGGIACGALIILPLYCTWRYFPTTYRSITSGIILSAYALSPLFTSIIALKLINPDNIKPTLDGNKYFDRSVAENVPHFLRVKSLICFATGLVGTLMVTTPLDQNNPTFMNSTVTQGTVTLLTNPTVQGEDLSQQQGTSQKLIDDDDLKDVQNSLPEQKTQCKMSQSELGPSQLNKQKVELMNVKIEVPNFRESFALFKDTKFILIILCQFLGFLYPHYQGFQWKSQGLDVLKDDAWVTFCGILGAIFNALSRIVTGMIYDRWGFGVAAGILLGMIILSAATFEIGLQNEWSFLVAVSAYYWSYGGQLGLYPLVTNQVFKERGSMAYSMAFSAFAVSCIFTLVMKSHLTDMIGFKGMLLIYSVVGAVAFIPMLCLVKQINKNDKKVSDLVKDWGLNKDDDTVQQTDCQE